MKKGEKRRGRHKNLERTCGEARSWDEGGGCAREQKPEGDRIDSRRVYGGVWNWGNMSEISLSNSLVVTYRLQRASSNCYEWGERRNGKRSEDAAGKEKERRRIPARERCFGSTAG